MPQYIGFEPGDTPRTQLPPPNLYPHLRFAPYVYREFPQWVQKPGTTGEADRVLVADEEEKANVLRGEAAALVPRDADEKTHLYALADSKGIVIDRRWNMDTLRLKVLGPAAVADAT